MHTRPFLFSALLAALLAIFVLTAPTARAEDLAPTTTSNPTVATDELDFRLVPLPRAQLEAEAAGWVQLVRERAEAVADLQVRIAKTEGDEKEKLLEELPAVKDARDAVVGRLELVLSALRAKGGDSAEFDAYVAEVTGLKLDLTDTHAMWALAKDWLTSPSGGLKLLRNLVLFFLILFAARIVANIVGKIMDKALTKLRHTPELLRNFLSGTVRKLTFFVGIVAALGVLGVNIGPFLAAIGAAGFVIGFALQGTLANFANGVMLLIYRPFDIGDWVNVAGVSGSVKAMSLVSTTLKTGDNQIVIVPNSQVWGSVITNVTGSPTRRVDLVFGIGYEDDMEKAQQVLEKILEKHPLVLDEPAPGVTVAALADSSVNYNVRPWVKTGDYWSVYWDITRQVKERFDEEGISIPFPQTDVHLHQAATA